MRTIEIGAIKIHLEEDEEASALLEKLLKPLSNKEVAAMLGLSERTVMRWKHAGRLPHRVNGQVFFVDLIRHVAPAAAEEPAPSGPARGLEPTRQRAARNTR